MPRPPLKTARAAARARVLKEHAAMVDRYTEEELAKAGWKQETVTTSRWVTNGKPS